MIEAVTVHKRHGWSRRRAYVCASLPAAERRIRRLRQNRPGWSSIVDLELWLVDGATVTTIDVEIAEPKATP